MTKTIFLCLAMAVASLSATAQNQKFSAAEQQQISISTPGLFDKSQAFDIDFGIYKADQYSFPLPVGKAKLTGSLELEITTSKGDAVKAVFNGVVRLSRRIAGFGNVIVIRHENGLESVYSYNAENLVSVGQRVKAGQTIAIVGLEGVLHFALMVNGSRINPETLLEINSHRLRRQLVRFTRSGSHVTIHVLSTPKYNAKDEAAKDKPAAKAKANTLTLDPDKEEDPFTDSQTFKLDLERIEKEHWAYPLAGSHVISPYGGRRGHGGVDIKTRPNDNIVAAFDGVVTRSGPYFGYGNCIVIKHAFGFETLYSHQSKNFVKVGQKVKAGEVIGLTGRTGRATTEHLHFETHFKGHRFNPALLFDHTKKSLQAATISLSKNGKISSMKHR